MAESNNSVRASLGIEIFVRCPHCRELFDAMEIDGADEDSQMVRQVFPSGRDDWDKAHHEFSAEVDCPECGKLVIIEGLDW